MFCLFDMIRFDIRNVPDGSNLPIVARIFAERIAAKATLVRAFIVPLSRIFLRYPYRIKIEIVILSIRIPKYRLMSSTESTLGVTPVRIDPDNSITELELTASLHSRRRKVVEWNEAIGANMISELPAEGGPGLEDSFELRD